MTLRGGDTVTPSNLPPGLDVYFGYLDGRWADYQQIAAQHPGAHLISIAVTAADDADCLDVENGDATNAEAPGWVARQHARGVARPIVYTSVSNVANLLNAGIDRIKIRLWTAHYGAGQHICSPGCYPGMPTTADGTQWIDHNNAWDESLLADTFITATPPPATPTPPPPPPLEEPMLILACTGRATQFWNGNTLKVLHDPAHVTALQSIGVPVKHLTTTQYDLLASLFT